MSGFIVTEKAMRQASNARRCFYCQQEIGAEHNDDCVLIKRNVRIRMTVEYDIEVPAHWSPQDIWSHRNRGSWCADNALQGLEVAFGENDCMCGAATFEFVGETDGIKYLDE